MLCVNEIFHSIQGESTFAGRPCVFVRLTGCDLRCSWCDTAYAFAEGRTRSVDEVVQEVTAFGFDLVEITGGEPLLQQDVYPLMERLIAGGQTVLLETGGQRSLARVPGAVIKVVDIKCPGSGEAHTTDWANVARLAAQDEVKFVIADRADYDYAKDVVRRHGLEHRCHAVLFSPVYGALAASDLSAWVLADRLQVRVQLQLHKLIWGPDTRGV
ncbi:MAG: radical SAM protein [Acidobacteria bacterium]|nr:radical SAM protein [Acidobacteriota bacterium]